MGRVGCQPARGLALAARIHRLDHVALDGVCTHFAAAEEDIEFTRAQTETFTGFIRGMRDHGIDPGIVHAANSACIVSHPETWFDMVRPGIIAYGYYPKRRMHEPFAIKPVMELVSKVVFTKEVDRGTPISYGMTYRAPARTSIATVAAGYADGYNRLLSNRGKVAIRGSQYSVVGRVCMDQFMVDIGVSSPVRNYDDVILFGPNGPAPNAWDLAESTGTIPYEITCSVGKRVERVYVT